jgi:hypothetical protein
VKTRVVTVAAVLALSVIPLWQNACSNINFGGQRDEGSMEEGGATGGNPMLSLKASLFTPESQAFLFQACVSAIYTVGYMPIPLWSGQPMIVDFTPDGPLGSLAIPAGTYRTILLAVSPDACPGFSPAIRITNDTGTFDFNPPASTFNSITFTGPGSSRGILDVTPFIPGLAAVAAPADIQTLFRNVYGGLP